MTVTWSMPAPSYWPGLAAIGLLLTRPAIHLVHRVIRGRAHRSDPLREGVMVLPGWTIATAAEDLDPPS